MRKKPRGGLDSVIKSDYNGPMSGYTKLWSSIIHSTVWREEMHVKVVWITMLAMADQDGLVMSSLPGLADAARVTIKQAKDALEKLAAPDEYSRTKDHEGRRVEAYDGGWLLLNHGKYRNLRSAEDRRAQVREAVRRYRERSVIKSNQCNPVKAQAEAEAEAKAEEEKDQRVPSPAAPVTALKVKAWSVEACDDWIERFGGTAPGGQIGKALKPLMLKFGWASVRLAWKRYLTEAEAQFASAARFASTYGQWNGSDSKARPRTTEEKTIAAVNASIAKHRAKEEGHG